jgi:hypothetical protein
MHDRDRCKSHEVGDPPNPVGGSPPSQLRHGGYAAIPDHPAAEDLVRGLVERIRVIDAYLTGHAADLAAERLAADLTSKIGRLLEQQARASGVTGDTIGELLARTVDLLLDKGRPA